MAETPAEATRAELVLELRAAMKARDAVTTAAVRCLLSALDNKSAVPPPPRRVPGFHGTAEAPRHDPDFAEILGVFEAEADERRRAEADYRQRGLEAEAGRLNAEIAVIERLWPKDPAIGSD